MSGTRQPQGRMSSSATAWALPAGEWAALSDLRRLLLLRALRPDRVPKALELMCERAMGAQYVRQEAFRVEDMMKVGRAATGMLLLRGSVGLREGGCWVMGLEACV